MADLTRLLSLLEDKLVQHDENRKEVQAKLRESCSRIKENATSLEEKVGEEIGDAFRTMEELVLGCVEKINEGGDLDSLIKDAQENLSFEQKYEIVPSEKTESPAGSCELKVSTVAIEIEPAPDDTEKAEWIKDQLQDRLSKSHESMTAAQDRLAEICAAMRKEAEELEKRINGKLEGLFKEEDARVQEVVKLVKEKMGTGSPEELKEIELTAKTTLVRGQKYAISEGSTVDGYDLVATKTASLEFLGFEERKPTDFAPSFSDKGCVLLPFAFFDEKEVEVLKTFDLSLTVEASVWPKGQDEEASKRVLKRRYVLGSEKPVFVADSTFAPSTAYCAKMRLELCGAVTKWSEEAEFAVPEFSKSCIWEKETYEDDEDEDSLRVVTNGNGYDERYIGSTHIPPNAVTSWNVKILKSLRNNGDSIVVGVAPADVKQQEGNKIKGWHFVCYSLILWPSVASNYNSKEYSPKAAYGYMLHEGDRVGVIMDTIRGELSFAVNGVNLGVGYKGIPLDKPLVPCVILRWRGDSVELDMSEVKENVDSSINVPSNITSKSETWDSITLTWDAVDDASFYQIEVDGDRSWYASTTKSFTRSGFLPDTEYSFRVRAVRGTSVGEWSGVVRGRSQQAPDFAECVWEKCPDDVEKKCRYFVDEKNPRIIGKKKDENVIFWDESCSNAFGNKPIPLNKVTSWSIKILNSKDNDGYGICIGVAPSDIDRSDTYITAECGWYFDCYNSTLYSGPPHYYRGKAYGPRKGDGEYVHTGDSVGVVMDTSKGKLSFALKGVNLGVAYEGIPLDKPLIPCVAFMHLGDSFEFSLGLDDPSKKTCIIS